MRQGLVQLALHKTGGKKLEFLLTVHCLPFLGQTQVCVGPVHCQRCHTHCCCRCVAALAAVIVAAAAGAAFAVVVAACAKQGKHMMNA